MGKQKWINEGGVFFPVNGGVTITDNLMPGIWQVYQSENPMDKRLGLIRIDDRFEFNYKVYDFGGQEMFEKIKKVWNSYIFAKNNKNLGIIYNGIKGSGKTVSAKLLCNELNLPVIIVNHAYDGGILDFVQALDFECIIFIDEAEKTFRDEDQQVLLKMIDGVYNKSRKLYLLTTNTLTINDNLISRPGRIRYIQEFGNLSAEAVDMYINDNLLDMSKKNKVLELVDLLEISTVDILRSIIEEVNILGDIDMKTNLNIPRANYVFDVLFMKDADESNIPAVLEIINERPEDMDIFTWLHECGEESDGDTTDKIAAKLGTSAYVSKLITKYDLLYEGQSTNYGEIVKKPGTLSDPRFFTVKNDSESVYLCMIVRQRGNPSLYGNKLSFII